MSRAVLSRFHVLKFTLSGTSLLGTYGPKLSNCGVRAFGQARDVKAISYAKVLGPIIDLIMSAYPGATFNLDSAPASPGRSMNIS
jgi:hypothetical protein